MFWFFFFLYLVIAGFTQRLMHSTMTSSEVTKNFGATIVLAIGWPVYLPWYLSYALTAKVMEEKKKKAGL